jgi:23S rRNA (guanosine2251-2'-O)-methyltransferase
VKGSKNKFRTKGFESGRSKTFQRSKPIDSGRSSQGPKSRSSGSSEGILRRPGRWVIGIHSVKEVLKVRPEGVEELWIKADSVQERAIAEIVELGKAHGLALHTPPLKSFALFGTGHQGVACRVLTGPELDWDDLSEKSQSLIVVLDELEDPQNLGAILRTAWLMGAECVLTSQNRASDLTPIVTKIASGGAEHVPVLVQASLQRALTILKEKGFWIYGLDEKASTDLWETSFSEKAALVIGSEGRGIRSSLRGECDQFISISQVNKGHSYNASVAASLAMGEICRQQKSSKILSK